MVIASSAQSRLCVPITATYGQMDETAAAGNSEKHSLHNRCRGKEGGLGLVALSRLLRLIGVQVKIKTDKNSM